MLSVIIIVSLGPCLIACTRWRHASLFFVMLLSSLHEYLHGMFMSRSPLVECIWVAGGHPEAEGFCRVSKLCRYGHAVVHLVACMCCNALCIILNGCRRSMCPTSWTLRAHSFAIKWKVFELPASSCTVLPVILATICLFAPFSIVIALLSSLLYFSN